MPTIGQNTERQFYDWEAIEDDGVLLHFGPLGFAEDGSETEIGIGSRTVNDAINKMLNAARYRNHQRRRVEEPTFVYHVEAIPYAEGMPASEYPYIWAYAHVNTGKRCSRIDSHCFDWERAVPDAEDDE